MRLIDADALEELFRAVIFRLAENPDISGDIEHMVRASATVIEMIQDAPSIEVLSAPPERKTGRWEITEAYPHNVYCSECHKIFAQKHWEVWFDGSLPRNYCPNCGADMREER